MNKPRKNYSKLKIKGEYQHQVWTLGRKAKCHPEKKHYGLGLCFDCYNKKRNQDRAQYHAEWYRDNKAKLREQNRALKQDYKFRVLEHYGGLPPSCACCEERHLELLTVDHINGDGAEHRRTMRGANFYKWLIDNGFPSGFRILCMNCNWVRGKYGYCPHNPQMS